MMGILLRTVSPLTTLLFAGLFVLSANASVIIGPTAVDVSALDPNPKYSDPNLIINQSGITPTYASGIDDFSAYVAVATVHDTPDTPTSPSLLGGVGGLGSFYFDLGTLFAVDSIATWGQDEGTSTVLTYNLYASDTFGAGGSKLFIGNFNAGVSPFAYSHNFASIQAQFFELDVTSNAGFSLASRFNEVAFGATAVPVPATIWLFGSALGLLGWQRRKVM